MTWIPDMDKGSFCAQGDHIRAIGWLHPDHPFPRGTVPEAFLVRLREFERLVYESMEVLNWRGGLGDHECEFCPPSETGPDGRVLGAVWGHGQFGVPHGDILFGAPPMIVHYVEAHQYMPPPEFIAAVLTSPLPGTTEYRDAIEPLLPRPLIRNQGKPPLLERITADMKAAMKAHEAQRVSVLRLLLSEIKNFHIEKGLDLPLDAQDIIQVLKQAVMMREETIATCRQAGRSDLLAKELKEARTLREYLTETEA